MKLCYFAFPLMLPLPALAYETAELVTVSQPVAASACFAATEPVIALDYGSRYTEDSQTRSDFDAESNAAVNAALKPVDDFIGKLSTESNRAMTREGERATASVDCTLDRIDEWAAADALSELGSMNANISAPSRIGGIAFAYANVRAMADPFDPRIARIDSWLTARSQATMAYFDNEAPKGSAQNNLRAWAALSVARVGSLTGDAALLDWASKSVRYVACEADAAGALPLEMGRGPLALHYQLHATGALVMAAAVLEPTGADLFNACDGAIPRIVGFTLDAMADPSLVEPLAGEPQDFEAPESFEMAWAAAYLSIRSDDRLAALADDYDKLSNSKLGGDQSLLW